MNEQPDPKIRFVRFDFDGYYPLGGEADVTGSYPTLEIAKSSKPKERYDNWEILDTWTGQWY